jgi:hypothetical protein
MFACRKINKTRGKIQAEKSDKTSVGKETKKQNIK